jgi:ribosome recycling factor
MKNTYKDTESKMDKIIHFLKEELLVIRAGRANPAVLNKVYVDYYGAPTPINQVANVSIPEPRMLVIQPWDANIIGEIEKAILKSDIGITPVNDGKLLRLAFPALTEERRKELIKSVHKKGEDSKVAIRTIRRDVLDKYKEEKKKSIITEDDFKDIEKDIQEITDNYCKEIDDLIKDKEKELMEV